MADLGGQAGADRPTAFATESTQRVRPPFGFPFIGLAMAACNSFHNAMNVLSTGRASEVDPGWLSAFAVIYDEGEATSETTPRFKSPY